VIVVEIAGRALGVAVNNVETQGFDVPFEQMPVLDFFGCPTDNASPPVPVPNPFAEYCVSFLQELVIGGDSDFGLAGLTLSHLGVRGFRRCCR